MRDHPYKSAGWIGREDAYESPYSRPVSPQGSAPEAAATMNRDRLRASRAKLLAALKRVTEQLAHEHYNDEAWAEARAAIADAERNPE
jgi:hypothetical protein